MNYSAIPIRRVEPIVPAARPSISVCMIVRDEAANIGPCLESLGDLATEIVIVDTGSTDGTIQVAHQHDCERVEVTNAEGEDYILNPLNRLRAFEYEWQDDFAAARNESLRHASFDWVFWLDADDRLTPQAVNQLLGAAASGLADAYACIVSSLRMDDDALAAIEHIRLFRNHRGVRFTNRIHENPLASIREHGLTLARTDIEITHTGYQDPIRFAEHSRRNLPLIERMMAEELDNPIWVYFHGMESGGIGDDARTDKDLTEFMQRTRPGDHAEARLFCYRYFAVKHEKAKEHPEMERALRHALKEFPLHPFFLSALGRYELASGRPEGARDLLAAYARMSQPVIGLRPMESWLAEGVAMALDALKLPGEADAWWAKSKSKGTSAGGRPNGKEPAQSIPERIDPEAKNAPDNIIAEHLARYQRAVSMVNKDMDVLDLGCGAGYGAAMLAHVGGYVWGIDIDEGAINLAKEHYKGQRNLEFTHDDIRWNDEFMPVSDLVTCFETLEHVPDPERMMLTMVSACKPDGRVLLSVPLGNTSFNPHHRYTFQQYAFESWLHGFFDEVQIEYQRGDKFYPEPVTPDYTEAFHGEYAFAICAKPRPRKPLTSIIIPVHNAPEVTLDCLRALEKHTPEPHEIILIDNGSLESTGDLLAMYKVQHDNVRLWLNDTNEGYALANNRGLTLASGDSVCFLNNDAIVTDGWLSALLDVFKRHGDAGLVGPLSDKVSGPQGSHSATWPDTLASPLNRLVGFCLLAGREVIDRIGGFDPLFLNAFDDDDLCLRSLLAGFRNYIAPASFVHHVGGQTFKEANMDYRQIMADNWDRFKEKWNQPREWPLSHGYSVNLDGVDPSAHYVPLPW